MMPLTMVKDGERFKIAQCRCSSDAMRRLEELGLLPGRELQMVSIQGGDVIIKINETRLAINRGMATNIMVEELEPVSTQTPALSSNHEKEHAAGGMGLHSTRHKTTKQKRDRKGFLPGR